MPANPFDKINVDELLQKAMHAAAGKIPYGGGAVVSYVVDRVFFPHLDIDPAESLWSKMEGRVKAMIHVQVEDEIQRIMGEAAAASTMQRLRTFGDLFRQLGYIKDIEEKKLQLALLTNEASKIVADLGNIPASMLLGSAKLLKVMATVHIMTIVELKSYEPENYRYQAMLNKMAILYSDIAGSMYNRSMAWRLSQIAEAKGMVYERDLPVAGSLINKKKNVEFTAYDKYYNDQWQPGKGIAFIIKQTGEINAEGVSVVYQTVKQQVEQGIADYAEKTIRPSWTKKWDDELLKITQGFMGLVDWPGVEREKKGAGMNLPSQLAFPLVPSKSPLHSADTLNRIDLFLEQQMDQFQTSGPRYTQTYRIAKPAQADEHGVFLRADTYDTSVACIYLLERGKIDRARDLADGLVQAINHDPIGGGRIVAATRADRLIDPHNNYTTSIFVPDGGRRDVGNMSWAGIALTRIYHRTKNYTYLHAAETIGQWILSNCSINDNWKGFSGGEDHWRQKQLWRSVEHNVDCVAFFDNLFKLTRNEAWKNARESARTLVEACFYNDQYYITGTGLGMDLNKNVVPTDTQSWTSLVKVNPDTDLRSLRFMITTMETQSAGFDGTKFAKHGKEIQNEATAGAAMALWLARDQHALFEPTALKYLKSLENQLTQASNSIGYGIVATPAKEADTGEGLGWKYFNLLHVASTAWTGLAFLAKEKVSANPYASLEDWG